ncbi:MAG: acyltransferase, partial [Desulfobacteraceae bacterium]
MTARVSLVNDQKIKSILLLRSADLALTIHALDLLAKQFPGAKVFLLTQRPVLDFFKSQAARAELIEYPFRDFHPGIDPLTLPGVPRVDLALALYKNQGEGYEEVNAFLLACIRARFFGRINGALDLAFRSVPAVMRRAIVLKNICKLYDYHPGAALRSRHLSRRYGRNSRQMILCGPGCRIRVENSGKLNLGANAIVRFGYVPGEWQTIQRPGGVAVRIHRGAELTFSGSVNLFSNVKILVFPCARMSIGEGSYVAFGTRIFVQDSIEIGRNCAISWDVELADSDFHRVKFEDARVRRSGIRIGDQVWIGAGSRILKGVTLGNHVTVGAGSVVTRDFPDHSVIAGNPAKLIAEQPGE